MCIFQQSALLTEEILHQLPAFFFQNATGNRAFGMKGMGGIVVIATFLIATAIDNTGYLAPT